MRKTGSTRGGVKGIGDGGRNGEGRGGGEGIKEVGDGVRGEGRARYNHCLRK